MAGAARTSDSRSSVESRNTCENGSSIMLMRQTSRSTIACLAAGCLLLLTASAHADTPEERSQTQPDRPVYNPVAPVIETTVGATYLWRLPTSKPGGAGAAIPFHLGILWRGTNDHFAVGAVAGGGILMGRFGFRTKLSPGGWTRNGLVFDAGVYGGRISMRCDTDERGCTNHGTSGGGPQISLSAAYRWARGDGRWGISVGAGVEAAWLFSEADVRSGFHGGVSGVHVRIDL